MHHRKLKVHSLIIKGYVSYLVEREMRYKTKDEAINYLIKSRLLTDIPFLKFRIDKLVKDGFTETQAIQYIKDHAENMRAEMIF